MRRPSGNHDFDNGLEGLLAQMPNATFKMLSANYDFSNTILNGFTEPYHIYEVDGLKIGVYGLGIHLEGLVTKKLYLETEYIEPYGIAQDIEEHLKIEESCDLVICLSHLGYAYKNEDRPSDLGLATQTDHTGLDYWWPHPYLFRETYNSKKPKRKRYSCQSGWLFRNQFRAGRFLF